MAYKAQRNGKCSVLKLYETVKRKSVSIYNFMYRYMVR